MEAIGSGHGMKPDPNRSLRLRSSGALDSHPMALIAAPAVSFVGMIRSGSKGRAADRAAISVFRGRHPYRRGGENVRGARSASGNCTCARQTYRHPDPGKRGPAMIELRVLGKRRLKWLRQKLKEATGRRLGACPLPPSGPKEKRESGASRGEAEVCKLNPTPGSDCTAP